MPESYRYVRVRLQIEQQRFLNFALEAGILDADGELCAALRLNRSLLLAVLAEIKMLLENYAAANGRYEGFGLQKDVDWDDLKEPETDLMDFLCLQSGAKEKGTTGRSAKKRDRLLNNLRTILVEPKRLVWAAVDKESFEGLVRKLEELNSFLITLLDGSQIRRLQDTMSTSYLEIMQIRNDVESLTWLVKALSPTTKRENSDINFYGVNNYLSQAVAEEAKLDQRKKEYLKRLVEIKIQYAKMDQLSSEKTIPLSFDKFRSALLELDDFVFADVSDWSSSGQRTTATYRGDNVWIEWNDIPASSNLRPATSEQIEKRIGLLADLLCYQKPSGFRAPSCLGYVKVVDGEIGTRFGIVFSKPLDASAKSGLFTLRDLLGATPKPSLSARMYLCAVLARCVHIFHSVNWLHKGLRSDNITFFERLDLSSPYVSGFELSRPSIIAEMTEKPGFDPFKDIYRHPNAQSTQTDGNYRKSYDIYSLGLVIIEVALWKHIEEVVGFEKLERVKPLTLREMQAWLLGRPMATNAALPPILVDLGTCLQQVASACGDALRSTVECCLKADDVEKPLFAGELESATSLRLQRVMERNIVKQLERIAGALEEQAPEAV